MRHDLIIIDDVLRQHRGTFDHVYDSVGNMTIFTETITPYKSV